MFAGPDQKYQALTCNRHHRQSGTVCNTMSESATDDLSRLRPINLTNFKVEMV